MKKLALSLLAASLFLAACSKDDENPPSSNNFTYNGEALNTPYGYLIDPQSNDVAVAFADKDLLSNYAGTASAVIIDLDTLILDQTYTYMNSDSTGYDRKKNFEFAATYFKQQFKDEDFVEDASVLDTLTEGSVTIRKTQNTYNVAYELKYHNITVKGQYNGEMQIVE